MEILSLLRLNLWRLTALIAVSAICAVIAALSIAGRPVSYTADATVFVARALPSSASAFEVTPFAADFEATTQLMSIRTVVAERLELPIDDVVVTTERPEGSTVKVLASHSDGPTAERIAASMASASLEFLARDRVERSDSLLSDRQATADGAKAALRSFEEQNGYTDVVREYDTRVVQMLELEGRAEDQSAEYTLAERRQLAELAGDIRDELPALANKRDQYLDLSAATNETKFALDSVVNERRNAEAGLVSATTTNITATESAPVSKVPLIVQAAVAATMVVFTIGIALFFLVDLIRDRRSASDNATIANEADVDETSADDAPADHDDADFETVPATKLKPVRAISTSSNSSSSSNDSSSNGSSNGSATNGRSVKTSNGRAMTDQSTPSDSDGSSDDLESAASGELTSVGDESDSAQPSRGGRVIAMNPTTSEPRSAKRSKASSTLTDEDHDQAGTRPKAGLSRTPRDSDGASEDESTIKPAVGDSGQIPPIGSGTTTDVRRRTKISKGRRS